MGIFFVYILKSSVCLAVFYLFYRVLLSKETFHRFNRVALLGVLVLSCLVPLVEVTTHEASGIGQSFLSLEEMLVMVKAEPAGVVEETSKPFPGSALMLLVYVMGILFFVLRHLWSLGRMLRLLRTSHQESLEDGITLFIHDAKDVAPFSWMKYIAVSEADLRESRDAVLTHERGHIHYLHSWDLILAEVCVFLQWFNPAAWLLKQELQTVHEYEADEWVIENGVDAKSYQLLIIKKAVGARLYSIANSFNHSSLKKRITMMIKKKSNPWARMKYAYVLPLAAVAVAAFARPEVSNELEEISSAKINDLVSVVKTEEAKSVENSSDEKFNLSGQVMEYPAKKPVPGASILVRGTTTGTLADKDGKFVLPVKKGDVLVVSYVGLQTQQLPIEGPANLVVWMRDDVQQLDEMMVVAYASDGAGTLTEDSEKKVESVVGIPEVKETEQKDEAIFQVVEEAPQFPGGMQEAMMFLAKNMKYPVKAQEAKIEGRVIVQFVVKKDGSVSDVEVKRSVSPELDAEAVRVIGLMPKWIPGKQRGRAVNVKFTMPIVFRLQSPEPEKKEAGHTLQVSMKVDKDADMANVDLVKSHLRSKFTGTSLHNPAGKSPLIIIDGMVMGNGADILSKISPDRIQSVSVMKDATAMAEYGDKGKDGVIEIVTKKKE